MAKKNIKLLPWQDDFVFGTQDARYRAAICGIGTGKTFSYLYDAIMACKSGEQEENIVVLRKTYKSLVDSTLVDLKKYFGLVPHSQRQTVEFSKTKSIIRFMHGDTNDISNLKNMSITRFYIEQAEEYEDSTVFDWMQDRLRGGANCYGVAIANAEGHNWVWEKFINGATKQVLNEDTKEYIFRKGKYACITAASYANPNLPVDYIAYLDDMKKDNYKRWLQMVMNSFDVVVSANSVFSTEDVTALRRPAKEVIRRERIARVGGVDIARFGINSNVFVILDVFYDGSIAEVATEAWKGLDGVFTQGKIFDLITRYRINALNIDCDGLGGMVFDNVVAMCNNKEIMSAPRVTINEYHNIMLKAGAYANKTTAAYFNAKDLAEQGKLFVTDETVITQLSKRKYLYSGKQKILEKKKEWDNGSGESPDYADAYVMALDAINLVESNFVSEQGGGNFGAGSGNGEPHDLSGNFNY